MKFNAFRCPTCGKLCATPEEDAPVCTCSQKMELTTDPEDLLKLDQLVRERLKQTQGGVRIPVTNHCRLIIVEGPIPSRHIEPGPCAAVIMRRRL